VQYRIPEHADAHYFEGEFEIACSQRYGLGHHRVRGVIKVESDEAFRKFLADEAAIQTAR